MRFHLPTLVLAAALLIVGGAGRATPPGADVTATFVSATVTQSRRPALIVTYSLAARRPMRVRLRLFATPTEGQPRAAGLVADRVIAVDRTGRAAIAVPFTGAGDIELSLIAEPADGGLGHGDIRYVRLDAAGAASVFTMAAYLRMHGREVAARRPGFGLQPARGPDGAPLPPLRSGAPAQVYVGGGTVTVRRTAAAAEPRPLFRRAAATAWAQAGNQLVLEGTLTTEVNNVVVPMRNTVLQVWDYDPISPNDLLGTTQTDENGQYQITVTNDDGLGGGGVDIYFLISADQSSFSLIYWENMSPWGYMPAGYAWQSPTTDNVTGQTAGIDFMISDNAAAAAVWSGASRAQWLAAQHSGHDVPSFIQISYPGLTPGITSYTPSTKQISIDAANNAPDVVGHEYGHAVMDEAYDVNPSEGGAHYFCATASNGLAWSEGFALYYGMVAGDGDGMINFTVGDTGRSIENWNCDLQNMPVDEGAVAAALWDLWDTPQDDNGGNLNQGRSGSGDANQGSQLVTIDQILATLWISEQPSIMAYWSDLQTQLQSAQAPTATVIMNYNWYQPLIQWIPVGAMPAPAPAPPQPPSGGSAGR